mmetsp:Transcript_14844/g.56170  ORF Transcript_14844/g.56170 Transcript_14844/m.56170 type:complete len:424 (+) Transcript_14844:50-1321(+)
MNEWLRCGAWEAGRLQHLCAGQLQRLCADRSRGLLKLLDLRGKRVHFLQELVHSVCRPALLLGCGLRERGELSEDLVLVRLVFLPSKLKGAIHWEVLRALLVDQILQVPLRAVQVRFVGLAQVHPIVDVRPRVVILFDVIVEVDVVALEQLPGKVADEAAIPLVLLDEVARLADLGKLVDDDTGDNRDHDENDGDIVGYVNGIPTERHFEGVPIVSEHRRTTESVVQVVQEALGEGIPPATAVPVAVAVEPVQVDAEDGVDVRQEDSENEGGDDLVNWLHHGSQHAEKDLHARRDVEDVEGKEGYALVDPEEAEHEEDQVVDGLEVQQNVGQRPQPVPQNCERDHFHHLEEASVGPLRRRQGSVADGLSLRPAIVQRDLRRADDVDRQHQGREEEMNVAEHSDQVEDVVVEESLAVVVPVLRV